MTTFVLCSSMHATSHSSPTLLTAVKLLIWKYRSGASNGDRGLLFFWSLMRMEDNILLRQFLFLFEETPSSYRWRSKHALTNGCWPLDCPRGDFPFELSNKVTFASLQNQSTEAFCWVADYPTRTLWRIQGKEHGCPSKPQFADDSQSLGWHSITESWHGLDWKGPLWII